MELQRPFEVVTPTLDGDVLAVLALAEVSFTVTQLQRMVPASGEGIRKVLRRLVRQGIVSTTVHGRMSTYSFNREHLAAPAVIELAHLRTSLLTHLDKTLSGWEVLPTYAAVFGSAGRGTMTTSSDIDILLVRPDDSDEDQWAVQVHDLVGQVTRWTGNDTRVIEYVVSDVLGSGEPVLHDVVKEGLTVHGEPNWLRTALRRGNRR